MKKISLYIVLLIAGTIGFAGFVSVKDKPYKETKNGITVSEGTPSTDFPKAKLNLEAIPEKTDTGMMSFKYAVENYTLGEQTPDATQKMCANSAQGQHIHFILDNKPYVASYKTTIDQRIGPGEHVLLSFLSRSYHESIKHRDAYVLTRFNAGGPEEKTDLKDPMLFYSRPKGNYTGEKEIKKLLLDFYLVNAELEKDGFQVKATIDGTDFMLPAWKPYYIEGLKPGKHKVRLQLVDKKGASVKGRFNDSGDREFTLIAGDPIEKMK